jgi:hypothetical protein
VKQQIVGLSLNSSKEMKCQGDRQIKEDDADENVDKGSSTCTCAVGRFLENQSRHVLTHVLPMTYDPGSNGNLSTITRKATTLLL